MFGLLSRTMAIFTSQFGRRRSLRLLPVHAGYTVYFCALLFTTLLLCSQSLVVSGAENTQDLCNRDPPDTLASQTPGDNGFQIKIIGRPQPERYTPEQVYTIVINGTYPNQKLLGFMLVAVTLNAQDETTTLGNFQHMNSGATKYAEDCPHVITHTSPHPKAGAEVLWTAPPAGTGCIEFRATVIEYNDIWYKDDGALTRVFCEETGTTENNLSPEMIPDCCACGSAKYQMTFEGTWSRRTHPKQFPTQKTLLHWSNIVGASHSKHYTLWQYGEKSSQGVKQVCEFGYTRILEEEMRDHSRDVRTVMKTTGIWWNDDRGLEQMRWARFSVDRKNHLLSMLTMLGPSPDWCVGISAVNLCLPNCTWTGDLEVQLYPWDAGTDEGITYMAPNKASIPPQNIHRITNTFPNSQDAPFYGADPIEPLASIKIRRIQPKVEAPQVCTGSEPEPEPEPEVEVMMTSQGKCAVSDWAEWSECSVTCGVGQRFRKRMYTNPDVDENMCGHSVVESENCIGIENECETLADECAVSRWSDWSPCTTTCGKGTRERVRFYYRPDDMKTCNRKLTEMEICMADIPDCNVLSMLNFTAICTEPVNYGSCRSDFQRFYFDVDMNKCLPFSFTGCRGNRNNFMRMEDCSDACFSVMKEAMMRKLQNVETPGGLAGPDLSAIDDPSAVCRLPNDGGPCKSEYTRYYFDMNMLKCLPFTYGGCQGNGNNFEAEEDCMDQCLMVMKAEIMRRKPTPPDDGTDENSTEKPKKKKKDRNRNRGPKVDCMVTEWSDWSECSSTCGRGYKTKTRMVKREPVNGGKRCPKRLERKKKCKTAKCREHCNMSDWGPWTPCPKTCGGGSIQERTRYIISAPNNDPSPCGARIERRYCTLPPCPGQRRRNT